MKITSKFLTKATAAFLLTGGVLGITTEITKHNSPKTENVYNQTNPIEDYADPLLKSLLGLSVLSFAGAFAMRRQEKVQAAKEAKQSIIDIERERLIKNINYRRKCGLNYTGDMKETKDGLTNSELYKYISKMYDILRTEPDTKSGHGIDKDEYAKSLIERAKKATEIVMNYVKANGCDDYLSDEFRRLNLMSSFFQYISDSPYNECDNITKLNIVLNVFRFCSDDKPYDETRAIVDAIESKALKELSEKLYGEAKKASDKRLSKSEIETLIKTKLGTLCTFIDYEELSKMMVQNAYTERNVLDRLAHTLAVTPWYELSSESFQ